MFVNYLHAIIYGRMLPAFSVCVLFVLLRRVDRPSASRTKLRQPSISHEHVTLSEISTSSGATSSAAPA